ncbi:MAG TPA: Bcr/CflA family multidrug efflux MFS transporter [Methylomirabilota bacterium]
MAGAGPLGRLALILGALSAFGSLSIDMYLPSFQAIARDLAASEGQVQLTLAVFFGGLGIGQAFYGPISDRYGRMRPLCFGLALYVLASAACALAPSVEALVAWRFVQSIGGCAGLVIVRAFVRDRFDERDSARVFSLLMLVMGLFPILAPLVGGQILVRFGWRAIFWALAAYALVCLATVLLILRESLPAERRSRGGVGEVLRVYARLLRDRGFMRYNLSNALGISGMFAYIFGSPFVFMQIFGVRPEHYGWLFGLNALGLIVASQLNHVLLRRVEGTGILSRALVVTAGAGVTLLAAASTGAGGLPGLLLPLFVYVSSLGFVLPNVVAAALAPQGRNAGSASALLGTVQFGAGAIIGTLLGALGNGTAVPMASLIAACGLSALAVHRLAA